MQNKSILKGISVLTKTTLALGIIALLIVVAFLGTGVIFSHAQGSYPDGLNDNACYCSSQDARLSTTSPNNYVVAMIAITSSNVVVTSIGSVLQWHIRTNVTYGNLNVEEWYAQAAGTLTSSDITVNLSGVAILDFTLFGVPSLQGFDPKLPISSKQSQGSNPPTVSGISTSTQSEFVFVFSGGNQGVYLDPGTGYTSLDQLSQGGGSLNSEYQVTTSQLAGASASFVGQPYANKITIADALILSSSSSSTITSTTSTTSTTSITSTTSTTTTSTSTTSSVSSTTSSSSTSTIGSNTYYSGAISTDSGLLLNNGVRFVAYAQPQTVTGALLVWIDDYFSNGMWAQAGWYIANGNQTMAFVQTWYLPNNSAISTATISISTAYHQFEMIPYNSTYWQFLVDGQIVSTFYTGQGASSSSQQSHITGEETATPSVFSFVPIQLETGLQYYKGGAWHNLASANVWQQGCSLTCWNVQGKAQSISSLANDQLIIGGGGSISSGTSLWNGLG